MNTLSLRFFALSLFCVPFLTAQPADNTQLKQVIIFGRHGVRTPILANSALNNFSQQPFPDFGVSGVSVITPNGTADETILGGYFRLWLKQQGLLTGKDS